MDGTLHVIQANEVKEGDIVVYSTPRNLTEAEAESVMKLLQGMFPKNKIALVDNGAKIDVVRP